MRRGQSENSSLKRRNLSSQPKVQTIGEVFQNQRGTRQMKTAQMTQHYHGNQSVGGSKRVTGIIKGL